MGEYDCDTAVQNVAVDEYWMRGCKEKHMGKKNEYRKVGVYLSNEYFTPPLSLSPWPRPSLCNWVFSFFFSVGNPLAISVPSSFLTVSDRQELKWDSYIQALWKK